MRGKRTLAALLLLIFCLSCGLQTVSADVEDMEPSDFENAMLGVVTGSLYDGYSRGLFPEAEISYYNSFADLFQCVKQKKIDAFMTDIAAFNAVARTDDRLHCVNVPQYTVDLGFGFQKNEEGDVLQGQMNELLDELWESGEMDEMIEKWYGEKEPIQTLEAPDFSDNKKPLIVAYDTTRKPFFYLLNGEPAGLEAEVMYLFCEKYDYKPVYSDVPFASGLAGLAIDKYDMVCGGLYMTAERMKSVNFSNSYMAAKVVMVTYTSDAEEGLWIKTKKAFTKTILQENRWKSIFKGVWTTLQISVCAVFFGFLFGFLLYLGARSAVPILSPLCKGISRICAFLIHGTPTLVLLMLLYYTVFGDSDISGTVVAIIGFSLTFGSFVYQNLKLMAESVNPGQLEAAYALGYGSGKTFFRIVLPQAMTLFVPVCSEEIVSLIKATSVVGYVAVNDLTKIADIIRSTTFEAFFPLIAATVFYFILTWGTSGLMLLLQNRMNPKRRRDKMLKRA